MRASSPHPDPARPGVLRVVVGVQGVAFAAHSFALSALSGNATQLGAFVEIFHGVLQRPAIERVENGWTCAWRCWHIVRVHGMSSGGDTIPLLPLLPVALPVTVQLRSDTGACWTASHAVATKNTTTKLVAKGE